MKTNNVPVLFAVTLLFFAMVPLMSSAGVPEGELYEVGPLKPVDSTLKVKVGDTAPDFTLRLFRAGPSP